MFKRIGIAALAPLLLSGAFTDARASEQYHDDVIPLITTTIVGAGNATADVQLVHRRYHRHRHPHRYRGYNRSRGYYGHRRYHRPYRYGPRYRTYWYYDGYGYRSYRRYY